MSVNILQLRRMRRDIERTLNLVGNGQRITEHPGGWWSMNLLTRQVEWTPFLPFEPYAPIDEDGIMFLCTHEASHGTYSGTYETKRIRDDQKAQFHRLVNCIEDNRVDRLSAIGFGGFQKLNQKFRMMMRANQGSFDGLCLVDAVAFNAKYSLEHGLPPEGTDLAKEASLRLWPRLDRIANTRSTQELATALEPIYLELVKIEEAEQARQRQEEEQKRREEEQKREAEQQPPEDAMTNPGDGGQDSQESQESQDGESGGANGEQKPEASDEAESGQSGGSGEKGDEQKDGEESEGRGGKSAGSKDAAPTDGDSGGKGEPDPLAGLDGLPDDAGADQPTDSPVKSEGDPGTEPLPIGAELEGMAKDATDQDTRDELTRRARENVGKKREGEAYARQQLGQRASWTQDGENQYEMRLDQWRGKINVLTQRLKTVLRHNSMTHPQGGQRRGRFDPGKACYRLRTGNVKVFEKPGVVGGHDYTFGLLIDVSSSMNDRREIKHAFDSVVLISEALNNAGLNVFVILWGSTIHHFKPIREPLKGHHGPLGSILVKGRGGTYEALALALAFDEFKTVTNGKKMLITVTDGETKFIEQSVEIIGDLEDAGVKCCTIRIGGRPAPHYERGFQIAHADELTQLLPQLINEVVARAA